MRREHQVPLSRQALALLEQLKTITGTRRLVFPGLRTAERPISENTMNAALRRLGYSQDQVTAHGFRATASTLLNESGKFSADAIERALAHQDPDPVRRAYARGAFWKERVEMCQLSPIISYSDFYPGSLATLSCRESEAALLRIFRSHRRHFSEIECRSRSSVVRDWSSS